MILTHYYFRYYYLCYIFKYLLLYRIKIIAFLLRHLHGGPELGSLPLPFSRFFIYLKNFQIRIRLK